MGEILNTTLNEWNRPYRFKASTAQRELFNFSMGECIESRPGWGYNPLGAGGTLVGGWAILGNPTGAQ